MEPINTFFQRLSTSYPLDFTDATFCFEVSNSGRRGESKKFCITYENVVSSLKDIKGNLTSFPSQYNETTWRSSADQHFSSNEARSLCGVQTRPYFEMVNKIIAWANNFNYIEGQIQLDVSSIDSAIVAIETHLVKKSLVVPLIDEEAFVKDLDNEGIKQKLALILAEIKTKPYCSDSVYFGFKYGSILEKYGLDIKTIFNSAGVSESYTREYERARHLFSMLKEEGFIKNIPVLYENTSYQDGSDVNSFVEQEDELDVEIPSFTPAQTIYYGVPGCGKSKKITDLLEAAKLHGDITDEETQVARVVFHPEYTNAEFVGQVMPMVKPAGGVDYHFAAGPFTRILARAYANPTKPYYLIIEEINRGNATAIFGEIFQLLDRHKKGESDSVGGNTYTAGWSKYFVDHVDVNGIIRKEISDTQYESDAEKPTVNFTANTAIRLPPNLSIYATMNTSDQNVFTLDNAFKRRFDSELIKNSLDGEDHKVQRETKIEGTDVTWGKFWESINDLILEKHSSMTSSEDKRLGAYFIVGEEKTAEDGTTYREISKKLFGEKVLEYLWDDAFKYKRKDVFTEDCKSVESLIEKFTSGGFSAVFKNLEF